MTYSFVGAASEILEMPASSILEEFGKNWVLRTAEDGYGDMMAAGGKTLREFLVNLPDFHSRVSMVLPHIDPPKFFCTELQQNSIHLHYQSHRAGLASFVTGLFKGLGQRFGTAVEIEQIADKTAGADHDEFVVRW